MKVRQKCLYQLKILLIKIFVICFLFQSSNILAQQKNQKIIHLKNEKNLEEETIFGRKLDFQTDSLKVCSRSSEKLIKYFETGDTQFIKLFENKENDEPKEYITSLINFLSNEGSMEENINKYISHLSFVVVIFVLFLLSIPGWIFCCSSSCCKCCFCCCLKKQKCKKPFFIIISIMNLIIFIISILGIIKTNIIFVDLSNAECSILRFINEVINGELKNDFPKWGGIDNIINIFKQTKIKIRNMDGAISSRIESKTDSYKSKKDTFKGAVESACRTISTELAYKFETNFVLDIVKKFGKFDNDDFIKGYFD